MTDECIVKSSFDDSSIWLACCASCGWETYVEIANADEFAAWNRRVKEDVTDEQD